MAFHLVGSPGSLGLRASPPPYHRGNRWEPSTVSRRSLPRDGRRGYRTHPFHGPEGTRSPRSLAFLSHGYPCPTPSPSLPDPTVSFLFFRSQRTARLAQQCARVYITLIEETNGAEEEPTEEETQASLLRWRSRRGDGSAGERVSPGGGRGGAPRRRHDQGAGLGFAA